MHDKKGFGLRIVLLAALLTTLVLGGCATTTRDTDTLHQVSVLNALLLGEYDGIISVGELKELGDTGIGTFDTLEGEMILLEGTVYQAKADGTVVQVGDETLVPFAMTTYFASDISEGDLSGLADINALKERLDQTIMATSNDFNRFYAALITGSFSHVRVRSVPGQTKPYPRLSAIAAEQKEYAFEDVEGTIVAFRCPQYVNGINMPTWHLHFLSSDASRGGHLLEATLSQGKLRMGDMKTYQIQLPSSSSFASMDIANDLTKETHAVEGVK
ncbi:MAG: acetolactate decarboxylase [Sphaerochaeta sp.]|nr:acetolactate decarboxylase [Sphaerochaeta sp.]